MAHSNWLELTLIQLAHHPDYQGTQLGHQLSQVFPHVGRSTLIRLQNGVEAYPIVTGTFGAADFRHRLVSHFSLGVFTVSFTYTNEYDSLMGEVADSISQMSTKELRNEMKRHRRLQKETERAAKAKYKEGSIQRIQDLMQEFVAGVGCPLPETGVPATYGTDAGIRGARFV